MGFSELHAKLIDQFMNLSFRRSRECSDLQEVLAFDSATLPGLGGYFFRLITGSSFLDKAAHSLSIQMTWQEPHTLFVLGLLLVFLP